MALVSKILEATLAAGSTSVTFTDSDIPNSLIRVYSSDSNIIPESRILSGTSLTVIYAPQTNAIGVAVEIVKQGLDIIDALDSADADKALSAKQGRALKLLIDSIPEGKVNISDMNDVDITDIEDGQVLAWDETEEKFVNVDQGAGSLNYSTEEQDTGINWTDGKRLYTRTIISNNVTLGQLSVYNIATMSGIDTLFIKDSFGIEGSITYMFPDFGTRIQFNKSSQLLQAVTPAQSSWSGATFIINVMYTKS